MLICRIRWSLQCFEFVEILMHLCADIAWPCFVYCFSAHQHKTRGEDAAITMYDFIQPILVQALKDPTSNANDQARILLWVIQTKLNLSQEWRMQKHSLFSRQQKNFSKFCPQQYHVIASAYGRQIYAHIHFFFFRLYLKCILSVIQAINPDVIIQSRARDGPKDSQLEPLGGCFANRLAHQAVRPQSLRQNMTCLWVHLHVAGRGEVLLSHYNHILLDTHTHTKKNSNFFFCHFECIYVNKVINLASFLSN